MLIVVAQPRDTLYLLAYNYAPVVACPITGVRVTGEQTGRRRNHGFKFDLDGFSGYHCLNLQHIPLFYQYNKLTQNMSVDLQS